MAAAPVHSAVIGRSMERRSASSRSMLAPVLRTLAAASSTSPKLTVISPLTTTPVPLLRRPVPSLSGNTVPPDGDIPHEALDVLCRLVMSDFLLGRTESVLVDSAPLVGADAREQSEVSGREVGQRDQERGAGERIGLLRGEHRQRDASVAHQGLDDTEPRVPAVLGQQDP